MRLPIDTGTSVVSGTEPGIALTNEGLDQFLILGETIRPLGSNDVLLLTVIQVAQFLNIGRSKVYELLYKGELKSVKIGGSRRVRYSDLGEYVRYLDDAS